MGESVERHGPTPIDPALRIGAVALAVSDLPRSVDFYERVLGLPLIDARRRARAAGPDREHPALELRRRSGDARPAPAAQHRALPRRLAAPHARRRSPTPCAGSPPRGWPLTGASDHGVSEALYLNDPDGLGIEIYADRPREQLGSAPARRRRADGHAPLDIEDLLAQWPEDADPADRRRARRSGTCT